MIWFVLFPWRLKHSFLAGSPHFDACPITNARSLLFFSTKRVFKSRMQTEKRFWQPLVAGEPPKNVNGGSSSPLFGKEDILFGYLWCPHKMSCAKDSPVSTSFPASTRSHDFIKRTSFTYGFKATSSELRSKNEHSKGTHWCG